MVAAQGTLDTASVVLEEDITAYTAAPVWEAAVETPVRKRSYPASWPHHDRQASNAAKPVDLCDMTATFPARSLARSATESWPAAGAALCNTIDQGDVMKSVLPLALCAVALAGCKPNIDQARAAFCKDLGTYAKAVAAAGAVGPDTTVKDFVKAQKAVDDAYQKVEKDARRLSAAQNDALRKVNDAFAKTVGTIQGTDTLGSAATTLSQATAAALDAYSDIATTTCVYGAPEATN